MSKTAKKLLWIGWDGADWEHITPLLDQGLLPNLNRLIDEGCMGNLASLQPMLSPMLWNSAATGKYAHNHGIHGFVEPDPFHDGARPSSSHSRKSKALWNILSQQGLRSNVINWWASHPAEQINGCVVSNMMAGIKFGPDGPKVAPGTIHPAEKSRRYGRNKVMPEEIEAEQICAFIPRAAEIDQEADSRLQSFANTFAETLTTHAMATDVMENEPWDFMAVYYTAIDHFSHSFMPYYPPRLDRISERDFEIFKDVVPGAYRFSDMMLGRLLHLAGDDCTVLLCSDHGFHSGAGRPLGQPREPSGPAVWHRPYGMFVMKGPGIKRDERIYGASLIDIAPTILAAMDQPIGEDMEGRPLLEIFEEPPEIRTVPSWETVEGPQASGVHDSEEPLDPEDAEELLKQFVALGYMEDPGEDQSKRKSGAEIECQYNLARSFMFVGNYDAAIPLLEDLVARDSWESRFVQELVFCFRRAGYLRQALALLEAAYDIPTTHHPQIRITWASLQVALGNATDAALDVLETAETAPEADAQMLVQLGQTYVKLERWGDAERVYRRAVEINEANAEAWLGLSRVYREMGEHKQTVEAALKALGLVYRLPHAHLNFGIALAELGQTDRAITALTTALRFSNRFRPAHEWLARVYGEQAGGKKLAAQHDRLAKAIAISESKVDENPRLHRRDKLWALPPIPDEGARFRRLVSERPNRPDPRAPSGKTFVLVSGLPRSGTSLMMQMLEAGGLPAKVSEDRPADVDNPKGYYEWEAIKKARTHPQIFDEPDLQHKAIKCVTALLDSMPYAHNYKTIFMTRPVEEVAASQLRMIERLQTTGSSQTLDELTRDLAQHRVKMRRWLDSNPRNDVLEVDYPALVANPELVVPLIADFLGDRLPNPDRMASVVDASLYRRRSEP